MSDEQDELDVSLPLPTDSKTPKAIDDDRSGGKKAQPPAEPAVELIRQKVKAAYSDEPDVAVEVSGVKAEVAQDVKLSKHQKFIQELSSSGKTMPEIQEAWHDYYAGLPDEQKHEVWQEYYAAQAAGVHSATVTAHLPDYPQHTKALWQTIIDVGSNARLAIPEIHLPKPQVPKAVHSLLFGISMGTIVLFIVLFSFFNERFIAPLIQPSRSLKNIPLISGSTAVGPNPEIIIPKINVQIPVVYGVSTINEEQVLTALNDGVVHYADSALPGQDGNVIIVGHSSNNIFNPGKYKFAFVLLSRLEPGDTFYLEKDGQRYTYQVYQKQIVKPDDVSVLGTTDKPAVATLITCDPPGTSINRLVVSGEQISPGSSSNSAKVTNNSLATQSKIIPGNSQSLWARFWKALSR